MEINREAIIEILENRELDVLPPQHRALLIGLFSDGLQGLMDAAVVNNIDKLPAGIRDIVSPYLLEIDWNRVPEQASRMFNSFLREGGAGLTSVVGNLLNGADLSNFNLGESLRGLNLNVGGINLSLDGIRNTIEQITSGGLGGITQVLSDFGGMDLLSLVPGSGIIRTASTIMQTLFNGGDLFSNLFGNNGFGIGTILDSLGLSSTLVGLVAPILGLLGVGGGCPCAPGCRKTNHITTEKDIELLDEEKCETIISNASTSYFPSGDPPDPTKTNDNPVAEAYGFIETLLGDNLIPQNVLNLTAAILELPRLEKLGRRAESFQNADWPDFVNELSYTMRALEHGLKVADNNMTGAEKILRVIIDGQFFDDIFEKKRDETVLNTLTDVTLAVQELYTMIQQLDSTKTGPPAITNSPALAIRKTIEANSEVVQTKAETWIAHIKKIKDFIEFALEIWNSLEPGAEPEELNNMMAGSSLNTTVSYPFPQEELEKDLERFQEEHYKMLSELIHNDDSDAISDIMDRIRLNRSVPRPLPSRQYQQTVNRLARDRMSAPDSPDTGAERRLPAPIVTPERPDSGSIPSDNNATRRPPAPVSNESDPVTRRLPTPISNKSEPKTPDPTAPRDVITRRAPTPIITTPRLPITLDDLERLAEETGNKDYNALVRDLLEQQEKLRNGKENC